MELKSNVPDGPLDQKWTRHKFEMKLVSPTNKLTPQGRQAYLDKRKPGQSRFTTQRASGANARRAAREVQCAAATRRSSASRPRCASCSSSTWWK